MKIAITGGTGFIGSHFLNQALVAGHTVMALRRNSSSNSRIPLVKQPYWLDRQLDEVSADELVGYEVLVHLATHTGNVPYDNLANCLHWNLMAVIKLFEQARLAGIRRYIVAGSCFEYGHSGKRYNAIPTNAPLEPSNSYAASKAAASITLLQWAEEHKLSLEILRVFHAFGEGEPEKRFWPTLRRAAFAGEDFPMTAGEQIRDFTSAEDIAFAFLSRATVTDGTEPNRLVFNLTSGQPTSIALFAQYYWQKWKAKGSLKIGALPYRENEVMRYVAGTPCLIVKDHKLAINNSQTPWHAETNNQLP